MGPDRRHGTLGSENQSGGEGQNYILAFTDRLIIVEFAALNIRIWQGESDKYTKQKLKLSLPWLGHTGLFPGILLYRRTHWGYLTLLTVRRWL